MEFTKQMRLATRAEHSVSDALINAKLGIALANNRVWAQGLLVFYEIFKFLEEAMDRKPDSLLARLDFPGIRRTSYFEQDLEFYLGKDWKKDYKPRESVNNYLRHLEHLESTDPDMLFAYAYHLYMGLLAGGQILRRKRALLSHMFSSTASYEGLRVTEIKDITIHQLKKQITDTTNEIAENLSESTRDKLISESKKVFELNDLMVRSIEGTNSVVLWKFMKASVIFAFVAISACFVQSSLNAIYKFFNNMFTTSHEI